MTEREKLVEAMARAAHERRNPLNLWEYLNPLARQDAVRDQAAALAAIEAHGGGCRVVPLKPTEWQLECGDIAADRSLPALATKHECAKGVTFYEAMVIATPMQPPA